MIEAFFFGPYLAQKLLAASHSRLASRPRASALSVNPAAKRLQ